MEQKKYLVCIDSDGCAIDSMNIKHFECFGPAFITTWKLEDQSEKLLKRWNEINLFSSTRGINRFKGLALILQEAPMDDSPENIQSFIRWTETAPELSNTSLLEYNSHDGASLNPVFSKALSWSLLVNKLIEKLPISQPFPHVKECMAKIKEYADIAVVSSANKEAILMEWNNGGLSDYVDHFFSQSDGSKSQCIHKMILHGYRVENILMVGDAPGDCRAAAENHVWFYPILAGKEADSWNDLLNHTLDMFFKGNFSYDIQLKLIKKMEESLK